MTLRISGGRRLRSPVGQVARPTAAQVRLAVLNLLGARLPGCHWLDPCCGSGAMACEALQRGVARLVAIERDRRVAAVARTNLEAVAAGLGRTDAEAGAPRLEVHCDDALRWLAGGAAVRQQAPFDLVYLDPPWTTDLHGRISDALLRGGWLRPEGWLIWEVPSGAEPELPGGWSLCRPPRRYGAASILVLQAPAG